MNLKVRWDEAVLARIFVYELAAESLRLGRAVGCCRRQRLTRRHTRPENASMLADFNRRSDQDGQASATRERPYYGARTQDLGCYPYRWFRAVPDRVP
jgi:hypothetical protein